MMADTIDFGWSVFRKSPTYSLYFGGSHNLGQPMTVDDPRGRCSDLQKISSSSLSDVSSIGLKIIRGSTSKQPIFPVSKLETALLY